MSSFVTEPVCLKPASAAAQSCQSPPGKPDWRVVGILLTGTFLAVLDFFIVNVAIPDLQRDLNASAALLSPQILAILSSLYEGTAMVPALNAYGLCMGMASVFGQVVGGLLIHIDLFGWGW